MSNRIHSPGSEASEGRINSTEADEDEDGWSDAEVDEEIEEFRCLFDDESFGNVNSMLSHCKTQHDIDLIEIARSLSKRVNFICGRMIISITFA